MSTAPTPRPGAAAGQVADASRNWVDTIAPLWARPYLRLARADRPIGSWLLFWPCAFSAALAAIAAGAPTPDIAHLLLFAVGAIAMRGAGCTYNDLVDRDIDAQVARTRSRPLPSGQVTPRAALAYLLLQLAVGLLVLGQFNLFTVLLGAASVLPVAAYPFMKRITWWPQAMLGICFGWGSLMGWAAAFGRLDLAPLLLFAGSICWIIGYDTIYAHQDKEDDALVGVRSTARLFGPRTKPLLALFYGLACAFYAAALASAGASFVGFAGLALFALHLGWQIARLQADRPDICLALFRSNRVAGTLLFAGLALDAALAVTAMAPPAG
jgi:4-hydroxybenzoate polyprenyltransferase